MDVFAAVWTGAGYSVGLVLNPFIHQLPRGLPVFRPPTCEACGANVAFLTLRTWWRRCPACGEPLTYDRVEWVMAALFLALAIRYGEGLPIFAYSLYTAILVVLATVDLRHRFVYAIVIYPGIAASLLFTPLLTGTSLPATLVGFAVGAAVFGVFYGIGRLVYRGVEPVGKGDIELGALMGAMVGFPRIVTALFLGSIANAVVIASLLLLHRRGRRDFVPYGPGLCLAAFAAFFLSP